MLAAGVVPDRYIVELSTEPVAQRITAPRGMGRAALDGADARQHRQRVRAEQESVRGLIEQAGGAVVGAVENVSNALIVRIPDAQAGRLAGLSGVRRVMQVREFHLLLDHALPLHRVLAAWDQVGWGNPGAGIRIAVIDTGVDAGHPGFQDPAMKAPAGFPRASSDSDLAFTNQKVIVARSYASLFGKTDPDPSARDHVGHGTATAMVAAGGIVAGRLAAIAGVAPKAYIGSYKVFGSPGVNDGATDGAILKAIDDAVADGMDIISLSLGSDVAPRFADDLEVQALERVAALGVVVVASAGNNGPDPSTVGSPADAPSVIAVGASSNDRVFSASVSVPGANPYVAIPGSGPKPPAPVTAPLVDVATLDPSGLACSALPPNSMAGSIAFILRGTCPFQDKLNNAQQAGAVAALVYTYQDQPDPIIMGVGTATLPAEMVSYQSGLDIKGRLSAPIQATLQFTTGATWTDPAKLAGFSAKGPNVDFSIKPDLVAVGTNIYTAAQTADRSGALYSADGFAVEQGTSFSAPLVAGAAAVLKAARPGLTAAQYRSLLVNTAATSYLTPNQTARVQQSGAGVLDVSAALNATAAAAPVSLSFGAGGSSVSAVQTLTISNVGTAADTVTVSVSPLAGGPAPQLSLASVTIAPGASSALAVAFTASSLEPGQYEGYITIQGTNSSVQTRVPYWYATASTTPSYITVLDSPSSPSAGATIPAAVVFRVNDASGLPLTGQTPFATAVSGAGRASAVTSLDSEVPNAYAFSVRLDPRPGSNVFRIVVGDLTKDVTIIGR